MSPGGEFTYVLSGSLAMQIGGDDHVTDAGASIYFDPNVPHGYRRSGGRPCCAIVVTTA